MPTFTEADAAYRDLIEAPGRELPAAFTAARAVDRIDMSGTDISHAVLLRLKSFFICQTHIKTSLGKVYAAPAADFFVETVCFFLRVILERVNPALTVSSERNIVPRRGSLRPDISVWHQDNVVAAIECKTQLGWNRDGWLRDFEDRESRLGKEHPNARLFLLVLTGSNWPGFGDDARIGEQLFVLLHDLWPNQFEVAMAAQTIRHPIEGLFHRIILHAEG